MITDPPPVPPDRRKVFVELARASWMSVIIAFGANFLFLGSQHSSSRWSTRINAILILFLALAGLIAGIVALCGVRRYGRKQLLFPAITGLCLWLALFGLAIPPYLRVRKMVSLGKPTPLIPVKHSPAATRIEDKEVGFSFDLPDAYEPFLVKPQGYRHAFLRKVENEPNRVLLVKLLAGTLPRQRLKPEEMPAGRSVSLTSFDWRGVQVDGLRLPEKLDEKDYLTFNVQIPLRRQAIQLMFGLPAESESEIRPIVEQVLSTLEGETNW
jgi:hypothetical protein